MFLEEFGQHFQKINFLYVIIKTQKSNMITNIQNGNLLKVISQLYLEKAYATYVKTFRIEANLGAIYNDLSGDWKNMA